MLPIDILLGIIAVYFLIGFVFGLYFIIAGAYKIDPLLKDSKKSVRFLLFPGVMVTWVFLIGKLFLNKKEI